MVSEKGHKGDWSNPKNMTIKRLWSSRKGRGSETGGTRVSEFVRRD